MTYFPMHSEKVITPKSKFFKLESIKKALEALHWIIGLLEKYEIQYQIAGGFAAKLYGSPRSLNDIDIDIPDNSFSAILSEITPYIIYGPARYKDGKWDCQLITLNYKGQEIDLTGSDTLKISNKDRTKWIPLKTSSRSLKIRVDGIDLNVIHPQDLIDYKKELDGEHQLEDIKAAQEYLTKGELE